MYEFDWEKKDLFDENRRKHRIDPLFNRGPRKTEGFMGRGEDDEIDEISIYRNEMSIIVDDDARVAQLVRASDS